MAVTIFRSCDTVYAGAEGLVGVSVRIVSVIVALVYQ